MRKSMGWAFAAVVLSLGCFYTVSASAQMGPASGQQPPQASGARIAVLDVGKIFKNHPRLKSLMEELKADVQRAEGQLQKEREEITKLEQKLQQYNKGTQAYNEISEEITKRQADLTVKFQIQKKQFQQRESQILHAVNQEILKAVEYFCKQYSIDMVMQYSGEPVDPDRPESVMRNIYKQMVWYAPDLDITDQILRELNRTAIDAPRAADGRAMPAQTTPPAAPYGNSPLR